ncbi:hypothetical protein AGOR_G00050000 [Albula goreensis]|uniref:Uncharacterized protein n=1 Tax=Albula goreensis TaxID=1534307 RepID=A0A8T3DX87_9TELE|nr:hypothetical protein AGOR_G00050000 [Albula goreensis]
MPRCPGGVCPGADQYKAELVENHFLSVSHPPQQTPTSLTTSHWWSVPYVLAPPTSPPGDGVAGSQGQLWRWTSTWGRSRGADVERPGGQQRTGGEPCRYSPGGSVSALLHRKQRHDSSDRGS